MGNHASQERRDRSKGGDLGQYGGSRAAEGQPFTLHPRTPQSQRAPKPSHQQSVDEDQPPAVLKGNKDKENEEPPPPRMRPTLAGANKKMLPVVIKWTGGGSNVAIAGTFNQWQKIPMVKSEKDFVAIVDLPEGSHEYKFLVDGEWKINKQDNTTTTTTSTNNNNTSNNNNINNNKEQNNNNVISISKTDFDEFETALLADPNDKSGDKDKTHGSGSSKERANGSDDDSFGQEIPEYQQSDKIRGPPVLPPHLLQVILNKDTPVSCEPTLLPQPNHVMLNHMYALSIRDGMMVLSTSNRYRKKCVTTLIYRPIE